MDLNQQIEEWFINYSDDIYNYLLYYIGNADVEDLVQEVFIKAIKGFKKFKGISTPKTWLFSIARNTAIDNQRKKKCISFLPYYDLEASPSDKKKPDEEFETIQEMQELYIAINNLKSNYREVILLRGIKDLSPAETAEILRWSETRVNVTLHRALKSLRKLLPNKVQGVNKYE